MTFETPLKRYMLNNVIQDLSPDSDNSLLFFIARPESGVSSDYTDSTESYNDLYRRMIAAKKVTSADAALMIPVGTWISGNTYDMYTSDKDMSLGVTSSARFYVYTGDQKVYKCIYNGATGSAAAVSTVQPFGESESNIKTADGYVWKFMYQIPDNLARFVTTGEIPIRNLEVAEDDPIRYFDTRRLQYSTQFAAVKGSLSYIEVLDTGLAYDRSVKSTTLTYLQDASNTGTTANATLQAASSATDDYYNGYMLRIVQGTGVGQKKKITDYEGTIKKATLESNWSVVPDTTSKYEIIPEVVIEGDGVCADANAVMDVNANGLTLSTIDLVNEGSGYTFVTARIGTTLGNASGATLDPHIAPKGGHGSDPESELVATKMQILVNLSSDISTITGDNREGDFPQVNNYYQYGLIRNPINATGGFKGEIAGAASGSLTDMVMDALTADTEFAAQALVPGDFVVGQTSRACGEVERFVRRTDTRRAVVTLKDVGTKFKPGEIVVGLGTGAVWTSSGKPFGVVKYQEDSIPQIEQDTYRLSTILSIRATGGDAGHAFQRSDITLDFAIRGACGSTATVMEFLPAGGDTADLYVTTIYRGETSGAHGFTFEELLANSSVACAIEGIKVPEFEYGTGEILYIKNTTTGITRNLEQEELFKITLDI
jgi:hypothetical protein